MRNRIGRIGSARRSALIAPVLVGMLGAVAAASSGCAAAQPMTPNAPEQAAPRNRDYPWMSRAEWWQRHRALLAVPEQARRRAELVFVGDSITEGWDSNIFKEFYSSRHALKFGIGGDRTQQVLFRIEQGELNGLNCKVLVLLIGTNNLNQDGAGPEAVARGVERILDAIVTRLPQTRVLLLGLLPRGESPNDPIREQIRLTNQWLSRLDDGRRVRFADLGRVFLSSSGAVEKAWMADFLHPTAAGYRRLAEALEPELASMTGAKSELHSKKDVLRLTLAAAHSPFTRTAARSH